MEKYNEVIKTHPIYCYGLLIVYCISLLPYINNNYLFI